MKRNTMRIVCNPYTNQISYYFKNEIGEWNVLSGNSILSRQYFTNTSMKERSKEIMEKADEIYNKKNKGLDILFEGTIENFEFLQETINCCFADRDIVCKLGTTKVAVVGKKSVGKSYLIEGLQELHGYKYTIQEGQGYTLFCDECNHAEWYEIEGIDLGKDKVEKAYKMIENLSEKGLSAVIYCISSVSGRIEEIEKELMQKIEKDFSEITVMIALTMCYKEDEDIQSSIDEILKVTDQTKIVPTLSKDYKTNIKDEEGAPIVIESFGLSEVSKYVFEGR